MGKKSRKKREKRLKSEYSSPAINPSKNGEDHNSLLDYTRCVSEIETIFSRYSAKDVCICLNVSDLWLPNISSQIKHQFVLGVFLSMRPASFTQELSVDTYESYKSFMEQLYPSIPSFPMLEDFIPETDWGDIKVHFHGELFKVFYGSNVERITDFIEAFKLKFGLPGIQHAEGTASEKYYNLRVAIQIQDYLLSTIKKSEVGVVNDISPGHIEIPNKRFWERCRSSLLTMFEKLQSVPNSSELVIPLGNHRMPKSWSGCEEALYNGTFLPTILAKIGESYFPISARNAVGVVLVHEDELISNESLDQSEDVAENIAKFIEQRFRKSNVITGPCKLATRYGQFEHIFSALILGRHKVYLVTVLELESIKKLAIIEKEVNKITSGSEEWVICRRDSCGAIQLQNRSGNPRNIEIIALVPIASPQQAFLPIESKTKIRVLVLPDFVTIFDSLSDTEELERFWDYADNIEDETISMSFSGMADLFGSFRDTHGVLLDGATVSPPTIFIDPHWGSNWRYTNLVEFWTNAPKMFPDDNNIAWKLEPPGGEKLQGLMAKGLQSVARYALVDDCNIYFVLKEEDVLSLGPDNGRTLMLFADCIADAMDQQKELLAHLPLFKCNRIVTTCRANLATLEKESTKENTDKALLTNWKYTSTIDNIDITVEVEVNLSRVRSCLTNPTDASFEVECLTEWLDVISDKHGHKTDVDVLGSILATKIRKPRFMFSKLQKTVDIPDNVKTTVPSPGHYKLARRNIAELFMAIGVTPGKYELDKAKAIIDPVKDEARQKIYNRITRFNRESILVFCIEKHNALAADYWQNMTRLRQSLLHEVDYDRTQELSKLHDSFIRDERNYKYLIERCLSSESSGSAIITTQEVLELIADIHWLFMLYDASDILYYGIDVGGVNLNQFYIPEIFYSEQKNKKQEFFSRESASFNLGLGLDSSDEVNSQQWDGFGWEELDESFLTDVGFSLTHLAKTFIILSQWQTVRKKEDLHLSYQANCQQITEVLLDKIEKISHTEALRIIEFITLNPKQILRLIGKETDEFDVPVWEYNKRGSRYLIRPLIPIGDVLKWGAMATDRAFNIWTSSILNGYLPASFSWPNVRKVIQNIKTELEEQLEVRAYEVCARATQYCIHGINLKSRFPQEKFDDIGDFDVLAYWPASNQWVTVECKYNRPPFCYKDTRRLRNLIFGTEKDHGQFLKIEKRQAFLSTNLEQIRKLLKWPPPETNTNQTIRDIYVSREIYWSMRSPPYKVSTEFVRIDALSNWLLKKNLFDTVPVEGNLL